MEFLDPHNFIAGLLVTTPTKAKTLKNVADKLGVDVKEFLQFRFLQRPNTMAKNLELEFLELLEPEDGIPKDIDITDFIMNNFPIPNLEDLQASYRDTDALIFIRKSDESKYWWYDQYILSPIYDKFNYEFEGKTYRYWFDTLKSGLKKPMYARITDAGTRHLYEYRTNEILKITNASIVKTNKAIRKNTKNQTNILIWTAIIAALSFGVSVTNLILNWPKKDQKPSQQLIINKPNIQSSQTRNPQSQPKSDTFYQKEAKKTLPKKK